MHGARNDFIVVDARLPSLVDWTAFALAMCDRRSGVGADGLLLVGNSGVADVSMRVINSDGSEAEMCGNGVRCIARYIDSDQLSIETPSGIVGTTIVERGDAYRIRVNMGRPRVDRGADASTAVVSTGNLHVVRFVRSLEDVDIAAFGTSMQRDSGFPQGVNVHAVAVESEPPALRMKHFERGAGVTLACGTGAVAAAAAAIVRGALHSPVRVFVPGGELLVEWSGAEAFMTGPAVHVFDTVV
ncbi:MAG: diaminopimelate epimerase [Candidatus Eremiobacteraeota bacterium]|nr:diaminopimelate epimerase [Candidatus Eremiobacteraeota bacterium]